jgi:branched-subunit amino acid transport protein AzlD
MNEQMCNPKYKFIITKALPFFIMANQQENSFMTIISFGITPEHI